MKFMPSSKLLAEEVRFSNEVIGMPWSGAVIGGLVEAEGGEMTEQWRGTGM